MTSDLLQRGARGGGITAAGQLAKLLVQFAGVLLLSRLLTPDDFGLVAMVGVFLALGNLIRDFGMPTAALQAATLSRAQASNLFWVNTALAAGAGTVIAALTPLLVWVYSEPRLVGVIPALALSVLVSGVQSQFQVQLALQMRFTSLVATDVLAQLAGLLLAGAAAIAGWGYWALVVQVVGAALFLLVARIVMTRWVPDWPRRGQGTAALIRAGGHIGGAQLAAYAANNADTFMIGVQWGATATGLYNRAFELLTVPIARMLGPLTQVVVPTLSRSAKEDGEHIDRLLLRIQPLFGAPIVWAFATSAAVASALIPVALGAQWSQSIPLFQILAIGGSFQAFSYISYWGFLLRHKTRQLLHYNLVTKTATVALIVAASFVSVEAVAMAYSISLALSWPINLVWLSRTAGQHSMPYLRSGASILAAGAVAFVVSHTGMSFMGATSLWVQLIVGSATSTAVFFVAIVLTRSGRRQLVEATRVGRALLRRG